MKNISKSSPSDIEWFWRIADRDSYVSFRIEEGHHFTLRQNNNEILTLKLDMTKDNHLTFRPSGDDLYLIAHFGNISEFAPGIYDYEVYVKSEHDDSIVSDSGQIQITE